MQAVFIAHHEFGAQHIFGNGVVAGQQRQHGGGVGFQQMFSFLVQQQLAQTVQHCGRLLVGHRHRDQQGNRLLVAGKGVSRAADRHGAAQIAFRTVVQPDALTEVQRRIVNDVANEGGIDSANFFQTRRVQRLQGQQIAGRDVETEGLVIQLQRFALLLSHQQRAQLFRGSGGLQLRGDRVIAQHVGQLTQQAEVLI